MKWYKNCFDSLKYSSIPIETVVIDNKSTDDTIEYIKDNYPEIVLIENTENLGFGKANNIGLKYALEQNADYVFLINQDAWVYVDTIQKLVSKMQEFPKYGILSPIHLTGSERKLDYNFSMQIQPPFCPNLISDFIVNGKAEDKIYPIKFVNAALWLMSKRCINTIGGFDPIFPHYGEDNNYIDRLEYHGLERGIYPQTYGVHDRELRNNVQTTKQKKNFELISYLIILTRLQSSYKRLFFKSLLLISIDLYKNLLRLSFKNFVINTNSLFSMIQLTPHILKNRKMAKIKGTCFLR